MPSTIKSLGLSHGQEQAYLDIIPACYAVCYVFGTIGSAWVIANLDQILLGDLDKVKKQTAELEEEMNSGDITPAPEHSWPTDRFHSVPTALNQTISTVLALLRKMKRISRLSGRATS